jgi:hypothetical protein
MAVGFCPWIITEVGVSFMETKCVAFILEMVKTAWGTYIDQAFNTIVQYMTAPNI